MRMAAAVRAGGSSTREGRVGSRARPNRARTGWAVLLTTALLAVVTVSCTVPPSKGTIDQGSPGADGPCGVSRRDLWNPVDLRHADVLFEPTGGAAPWTGGTCGDDHRPVVLIAHGYLGTFPEAYQGLIDHLVGNGFVVVFPGWPVEYDQPHQYEVVDTGFDLAVKTSGRVDTTRVGVVGHSFGGGMTPWLVNRVDERGWGSKALWAVSFAPWYMFGVGTGAVDLPERTWLTVVNYDEDVFVDSRLGIDMYRSADLPADQKNYVLVHTDRSEDPAMFADHIGPVSFELLPFLGVISTDHVDRWAVWRTIDATSRCTLDGTWCDTDLADMGTWPDGRPVVRADVSTDPVDVGPPALQECEFPLNPRPCN